MQSYLHIMNKPLRYLDDWLNAITMYRLVLYGLVWLGVIAALLSLLGTVSYPVQWLVKSGIALSAGCGITNLVLSKLYRVPSGQESSLITMLILFFILKPVDGVWGVVGLGIAGGVAVVSKYALSWRGAVVFNPAAFGALVVGATGLASVTWWVANKYMLIPLLILGVLVLRKTRRFELFAVFFVSAASLLIANGVSVSSLVLSFPLLFLGSIMLTEPATMPNTKEWRYVYALLVGVLCGLRLSIGPISISPHVALLIGNLFALLVSARAASMLVLERRVALTPTSYEFSFRPERKLRYKAGQYAEFTLEGVSLASARGNRRSFTIASDPRSELVSIGVKFYEPSSLFKQSLMGMKSGQRIAAAHIAGDFTLPKSDQPLLFIAGGIGITPFVAMIREQMALGKTRDIVVVYFAAGEQELAYKPVLDAAAKVGVRVIYMTDPATRLDQTAVKTAIPDFAARRVYISGPPGMVRSYKALFRQWGAKSVQTDYFTGY